MAASDSSTNGLAVTSEERQFALVVGVNNSAKSTYLKSYICRTRCLWDCRHPEKT